MGRTRKFLVGEIQLQMGTPEDETLGADCDLVVSNEKYGKKVYIAQHNTLSSMIPEITDKNPEC
jgi:hypothetical protein